MHTPRPTLDIDPSYCSATAKKRSVELRKKIRIPHTTRRVVNAYRKLQVELMRINERCSKKAAKEMSEDPTPYETSYVFYCL